MTIDLDAQLRQLVGEMVSTAPVPDGPPAPEPAGRGPERRGGRLALMAGALALAVVAALVAVRLGNDATVTTGPAAPRQLDPASLIDLQEDEWLMPTWLPDGYEFDRAEALGPGAGSFLWYRDPATDDVFSVRLVADELFSSGNDPGSFDVVEVAEAEWRRHPNLGLARQTTDGWVAVGGFTLQEAEVRAVAESLVIVPTSELPRRPLDLATRVLVGRSEWEGRPVELHATSDGRSYAVGVGGYSCCPAFGDGDLVVMTGGTSREGGEEALIDGIVDESVAMVRLVLQDGQTVELEAQDLSDSFPVNFVVGPIPTGSVDPLMTIASIVALDADGNELGRGGGAPELRVVASGE